MTLEERLINLSDNLVRSAEGLGDLQDLLDQVREDVEALPSVPARHRLDEKVVVYATQLDEVTRAQCALRAQAGSLLEGYREAGVLVETASPMAADYVERRPK